MSTQLIGQGDIGAILSFKVSATVGAMDLTGATVNLLISPDIPSSNSRTGTFPMVITDAIGGVVQKVTDGTEFPNGNINYSMQVKVTFPGGRTFSSSVVKVFCRPDFSAVANNVLYR